MKISIYKPFTIIYVVFLISCSKDTGIPVGDYGQQKIALEMYSHSTTVDQTVYVNRSEHADFLSTQIISALENDLFLRQKMNRLPEEVVDTIFTYDEIPYIRETKALTRIYTDGETEFVIDDLTPYSMNVLHQLAENPESEESRITKTVIKDGFMLVFNAAGQEVVREAYESPDMKEFIDSVKYYLQQIEDTGLSTPSMAVGRLKAMSQSAAGIHTMKILPDNKVQLESYIQPDLAQKSLFPGADSQFRAVTELNPEMTRTLKFEIYLGNQLIQRKLYDYNESVELKSFHSKQLISESPSVIESQTLTINSTGQPVIKSVREVFHRNQMIFY